VIFYWRKKEKVFEMNLQYPIAMHVAFKLNEIEIKLKSFMGY